MIDIQISHNVCFKYLTIKKMIDKLKEYQQKFKMWRKDQFRWTMIQLEWSLLHTIHIMVKSTPNLSSNVIKYKVTCKVIKL